MDADIPDLELRAGVQVMAAARSAWPGCPACDPAALPP
jgi:hypothetical protein